MSRNLSNFLKGSFGPQVTTSNTLNPTQLSIATKGYWFQSQILRIPEKYGFFSPGPPRLQVYQGFLFITLFTMIVIETVLGGLFVSFMSLQKDHKPIAPVIVALVAIVLGVVGVIWVMECCSESRVPDYVWEDWKLRQD